MNGKGKTGKGWCGSQKGKGKGKGLQSVSEWDQTEDYTMPILSMSCGEKQSETEHQSTCVKTREGNRQFVCNNKFEVITEHEHERKTRQDRKESEA